MNTTWTRGLAAAIACVGVSRFLSAVALGIKFTAINNGADLAAVLVAVEVALGAALMWSAWSFQHARSKQGVVLLGCLIPYHFWLSFFYLGTATCPWSPGLCQVVHVVYILFVAALVVALLRDDRSVQA